MAAVTGDPPRDGVFPSAPLGGDSAWKRYCLQELDTGGWLCDELTFFLQLFFYM